MKFKLQKKGTEWTFDGNIDSLRESILSNLTNDQRQYISDIVMNEITDYIVEISKVVDDVPDYNSIQKYITNIILESENRINESITENINVQLSMIVKSEYNRIKSNIIKWMFGERLNYAEIAWLTYFILESYFTVTCG